MKYRRLNRSDIDVSLLGLGCMRFPKIEDTQKIDELKAQEIIDYAYTHGVNYFDTAFIYHEGLSEEFIGKALKKYPRDTYMIADKMPGWLLNDASDVEKIFNTQLKRCDSGYFDFYLLHGVDDERFDDKYRKYKVIEFLEEMRKQGKIRHLGFSFHDTPEVLERVADAHDWDFAQIQLNYLDWDLQQARRQYEVLKKRNIQCIIMEPVRGGALADLGDEANGVLKKAEPDKSIASWAIRFAAGLENVLTVLSGMSNMEQVRDNVETVSNLEELDDVKKSTLFNALEIYRKKDMVKCTHCNYCMDCPFGVNIPEVFAVYNRYLETLNRVEFLSAYDKIGQDHGADMCTKCNRCIQLCPQKIEIPTKLEKINELVAKFKK